MVRFPVVAASCVLLACSFAAQVRAQSADALIERGVALRERGQDAEAADVFRRALEMEPTPRARAQLGLAEQALGRWVEAEQHLADALEDGRDRWIISRRTVLDRALAEIRTHVGRVDVECNVEGAELRIGGRLVSTLPASPERPIQVAAGGVELRVSAEGWRSERRSVEVPGGGAVRVSFELRRVEAPSQGTIEPPSRGSSAATIAFVGAGVLAAGAIASAIWWVDRQSELDVCAASGCLNDDELASFRTAAAITTVTIGVLALAAAGVGIVLVTNGRSTSTLTGATTSATIACTAGPAALSCAGRF